MAAKSSSVVVAYALQTVDKDTAATGTYTTLAKRSGGFTTTSENADTGTAANRLKDAPTQGQLSHSASFEMDFGSDIHDLFLRSAFASDWVTDYDSGGIGSVGEDGLIIGSAPVYMTFVVYAPYLAATTEYTVYTGCQVTSAEFTFPKDGAGVVGLTINLGVANKTTPATAPWSQLDPAPAAVKLKTCEVLEVLLDDVAVPSIIDSLDFSITSENESVYDIRQCDAAEVLLDNAEAGGTMVLLHDDDSETLQRAAGTNMKVEIQIDAPSTDTDYRIVLPTSVNNSPGPDFTADNVSVTIPYGATTDSPVIFRTQ